MPVKPRAWREANSIDRRTRLGHRIHPMRPVGKASILPLF